MSWPKFYPPNCPPADAKPANGVFFRLVKSNPPEPKDFIPHFKQFPNKAFECPCKASGISVNPDDGNAINLLKRIPGYKKKLVAVGELSPDCGVVLCTPIESNPSHHTWWHPDGLKTWTYFRVVDNIDNK